MFINSIHRRCCKTNNTTDMALPKIKICVSLSFLNYKKTKNDISNKVCISKQALSEVAGIQLLYDTII